MHQNRASRRARRSRTQGPGGSVASALNDAFAGNEKRGRLEPGELEATCSVADTASLQSEIVPTGAPPGAIDCGPDGEEAAATNNELDASIARLAIAPRETQVDPGTFVQSGAQFESLQEAVEQGCGKLQQISTEAMMVDATPGAMDCGPDGEKAGATHNELDALIARLAIAPLEPRVDPETVNTGLQLVELGPQFEPLQAAVVQALEELQQTLVEEATVLEATFNLSGRFNFPVEETQKLLISQFRSVHHRFTLPAVKYTKVSTPLLSPQEPMTSPPTQNIPSTVPVSRTPVPPHMSENRPGEAKRLKSEVVKGLQWGLQHATGNSWVNMHYPPNYERMVEAQWGWRLIGWPEGVDMQSPSEMRAGGSRVVRELWDRLRSGECYWQKMSPSEHQALKEKYKNFKRVKAEKS